MQNDGHQQGRSGRPERVPRNVPTVRTGKGQLSKAGTAANRWRPIVRRHRIAFAEAIDRGGRRGIAAGL